MMGVSNPRNDSYEHPQMFSWVKHAFKEISKVDLCDLMVQSDFWMMAKREQPCLQTLLLSQTDSLIVTSPFIYHLHAYGWFKIDLFS